MSRCEGSRTERSADYACQRVADRRGIGFGWLQNAWLLHARLKILTRGRAPGSEPTQKTRGPVQ
jgi:hypothetical protein